MLIDFAVTNYRSFRERTVLDLRAAEGVEHPPNTLTDEVPGVGRLLRIAAVYGANGSGKSNLVRAIKEGIALLDGSRPAVLSGFHTPEGRSEPSTFEFTWWFGERWTYRIKATGAVVLEEELRRGDDGFFLRHDAGAGSSPEVAVGGAGTDASGRERIAFVASAAGRSQSVMSQLLRGNIPELAGFHSGSGWQIVLSIAGSRGIDLSDWFADYEEARRFAERLLVDSAGVQGVELVSRTNGAAGETTREVVVRHLLDGQPTLLPFAEESDGTQQLAQLAVLFELLADDTPGGTVLVVDELERSLHPLLARRLLDGHLNSGKPNSQLVFTTHDEQLLDPAMLPADAVWFAEKDRNGHSHLHSLAEFDPLELAKYKGTWAEAYLRGRFGGIAPKLRRRAK